MTPARGPSVGWANGLAPFSASEDGKGGRVSLGILVSHPIQYFSPLFRELATRDEIALTVFYCSRQGLDRSFDAEFGTDLAWDTPLIEGYDSVFLSNSGSDNNSSVFFRRVNPGIIGELRRRRLDTLVVHGYEHATKWLAFLGAKLTGTRLLLRGESQLLNQPKLGRRVAKELVLRPLMKVVDGALYLGSENRRFYRRYGLSEDQLSHMPYVVDNAWFQSQSQLLRPQRRNLRRSWGIREDLPVVLACAKLIPKKQPLLLLDAFARTHTRHPATLVFAGEGPLRPAVETRARELGISDSIRITGFLNQSEIVKAYSIADMLVLPSAAEPWGLVVNEAMNFSLPIIASDRVGAAADLVRDGANGFVVPFDDPAALSERIAALCLNEALRINFGRASLARISSWGISEAADALVNAVRRLHRSTNEQESV